MISEAAYGGSVNYECVAVSTSSDATGSYYRYAFSTGTNLGDYPKYGVWADAYYASANIFQNDGTGAFIGAEACAYNRSAMLAGSSATSVCFQRGTSDWSLLPADIDGLNPPPSGEPNFYLELGGSSSLNLYKFHVNFTNPSQSTFTGPTSISVASYSDACGGNPGNCVPQPGTSTELEALGDRLLFRLAYRNLNGVESLVTNHSITSGSSVGVRWYEILNPNTTPVLSQQGTFAPDSNYRWMGSIASDQASDLALGYSVSGSSLYPSIRYTGRMPGDPAGTMEAENSVVTGSYSQTNATRWGDYSSMSVDPSDDCTFWYTSMYGAASGWWTTHIASFKFDSCPPPKQFVYTGSMNSARTAHTANLLASELVLVAGGWNGSYLSTAELYSSSSGTFAYTGSMNTARGLHTGTTLGDGQVLVAGGVTGTSTTLSSAELYSPSTGTFTTTGSLNAARYEHTATLLNNGMVLITGGYNGSAYLTSAELYNPSSGIFTTTGSLHTARAYHTATLLNSGMVLITGGLNQSSGELASAELYNPTTGTFTTVGNMTTSRYKHTATLLNDGTVLVAGGASGGTCGIYCATAELYNPTSKTFAATGSMLVGAYYRGASLLPSGLVLVAGGFGNSGILTDAELYNPSTKSFSTTGSLNAARYAPTATLLSSGMVLVAGGNGNGGILSSAELFQ